MRTGSKLTATVLAAEIQRLRRENESLRRSVRKARRDVRLWLWLCLVLAVILFLAGRSHPGELVAVAHLTQSILRRLLYRR